VKKDPISVGRPALLRRTNALTILKLLREAGSCSRADLVRASGMSAPTVTNVVADLLTADLIKPLGEGESSGGRPPDIIRFKAERGCILGVRISASFLSFLLTDLSGEELDTTHLSLAGKKTSPDAVCALISEEIRRLLKKHKKTREPWLWAYPPLPMSMRVWCYPSAPWITGGRFHFVRYWPSNSIALSSSRTTPIFQRLGNATVARQRQRRPLS
jgi:DNA-binding transcriptional ArsR family regulator